jgi:hypothetical protein
MCCILWIDIVEDCCNTKYFVKKNKHLLWFDVIDLAGVAHLMFSFYIFNKLFWPYKKEILTGFDLLRNKMSISFLAKNWVSLILS